MNSKELGKISSVRIGNGGYQDVQFGWWLMFSFKGSACGNGKGFWTSEPDQNTKWTKGDQIRIFGETFFELMEIMEKAKVSEAHELVGIPVEVEWENMKLKTWRVLEEVL